MQACLLKTSTQSSEQSVEGHSIADVGYGVNTHVQALSLSTDDHSWFCGSSGDGRWAPTRLRLPRVSHAFALSWDLAWICPKLWLACVHSLSLRDPEVSVHAQLDALHCFWACDRAEHRDGVKMLTPEQPGCRGRQEGTGRAWVQCPPSSNQAPFPVPATHNNALYSKPIGGEVRDSGSSHFPKPHLLASHWGQTFNMPVRDGIHIYTLAVGFCVPVYTAEPTAIPDVMHVNYRVRGKHASVGCHKGDP